MSNTDTGAVAAPETTEEATPAVAPLSAEAQAIVDYIDGEIAKIKALPKKSNYHNARASMARQIRELISPTPPAPPKEKKSKAKSAKAAEGGVTEAPAPAPAAAATPEVEGEPVVVAAEEAA